MKRGKTGAGPPSWMRQRTTLSYGEGDAACNLERVLTK